MTGSTSTVFVTSATGDQGTALCTHLLKSGLSVRATTRDTSSPRAQHLQTLGVHLVPFSGWDDEPALREGLKGCDKLYLCLFPNLSDFSVLPRQSALITRLAKEAGVTQAVASTTLGSFLVDPEAPTPLPKDVNMAPLFKAHCEAKLLLENSVTAGGTFEHWTILRPGFFMANFLLPKSDFFVPEVPARGAWTTSLASTSKLGLIDHVDIGRFGAAAFAAPEKFHGKKLGLISDEMGVQQVLDKVAAAIGDGRTFKAEFMSDEEIKEAQDKGSPLVFASETSIRYMQDYTDLKVLGDLLGEETMKFEKFLEREKDGVEKTYLKKKE